MATCSSRGRHGGGDGLVERGAGLQGLHDVPGGRGEVVGEPLDRPGAAGGVGDGADVRLVGQQRHLVAGDAAAEGVGAAEGPVEGLHGDGVGAADRRGEGGDRGAEHVDPGVVRAHHRPAGDGVLPLRRRGAAPQISSSRDQSSRAARSLAMVEELVVGRGVAELDQAGGPLDVDAGRLEDAQDPRGGDDRPAELLGVGGAPVVDGGGVDHDARGRRRRGPAGRRRRGRRRTRRRARPGWCRGPAWCRRGGRGSARRRRRARRSRRGRPAARSRRTPSRTTARSVSGPACSHSEVAPPREVREGLRVQLLRRRTAQLDADVAPAGRGGAGVAAGSRR